MPHQIKAEYIVRNDIELSTLFPIEGAPPTQHGMELYNNFSLFRNSLFDYEQNRSIIDYLRAQRDARRAVTPIEELLPMSPDRMLLHELMAQIRVKYLINEPTDDAYCNMVSSAKDHFERGLADKLDDLRDYYTGVLGVSTHFMGGDVHAFDRFEEADQCKVLDTVDVMQREIGKEMADFTPAQKNVCQLRIAAELYKAKANSMIRNAIEPGLPAFAAAQKWGLRPEIPADKAVTIFSCGGAGSGKSSSEELIVEQVLEDTDINMSQVAAVYNTDALRPPMLVGGEKPEQVVEATKDELALIKTRIAGLLNEQALLSLGHHAIFDSPTIRPAQFRNKVLDEGQVYVNFVTTDAETAVARSHLRAAHEHRHVTTDAVLKSHRDSVRSLIAAVNQVDIQGTTTTIVIRDNNGTPPPKLIGTIDCSTGTISIFDKDAMEQMLKKVNMRTDVESVRHVDAEGHLDVDIYPTAAPTIDEYFQPLVDRGYNIQYDHGQHYSPI